MLNAWLVVMRGCSKERTDLSAGMGFHSCAESGQCGFKIVGQRMT